ncbi:isochorismatase family protein [Actinomadura yumaensis]|uniref:Isochorismatase family protein n=1 Tax=Actinomadura yumaensis TaxID=111807 RepID=A0ABW2CNB7_9ACTN
MPLHEWRIDPREHLRHETRRGRRHAYPGLVPRRTALAVIDMVPFFVAGNPYCRSIVPNVNALAGALRDAGGTVAWVLPASEPSPDFFGPEVAELYRTSCGAGPLPGRLHPDLVPRPGDLYAAKTAPSAFFPGRCELPDLLAARGVDTVLIAGTVTNVCCESSARDAATLGHRVVMVADANAAGSDDQHNATLHTFYRSFGDVRATADVLAMIAAGAGAGAGADRGRGAVG